MPEATQTITIQSSAFAHGQPIPIEHTGDGDDLSPPLSWSGAPTGTKQFALICDDPDAPTEQPWVHWLLYHIPPETTHLPAGRPRRRELSVPATAVQGVNSFPNDNVGYRGPMPPAGHGTHHYHFKLYALDQVMERQAGLDKAALLKAMDGHVLAQGELVGTYER